MSPFNTRLAGVEESRLFAAAPHPANISTFCSISVRAAAREERKVGMIKEITGCRP